MSNEDNVNELIEQIRNVKPTAEPDDFLTVMKTSDRLCASYARCDHGCPFCNVGPKKDVCGMIHEIFEDPADFLSVIKAWAKEHPEMPCDAYNSGVCMSNGDKECSCGGDSGICEIMTKRGGIDSVC